MATMGHTAVQTSEHRAFAHFVIRGLAESLSVVVASAYSADRKPAQSVTWELAESVAAASA